MLVMRESRQDWGLSVFSLILLTKGVKVSISETFSRQTINNDQISSQA